MKTENLVALYYYIGGKVAMKQLLEAYEKLAKEVNLPSETITALKAMVDTAISHYEKRINDLPNGKEISKMHDKIMEEDSTIIFEEE